MLLLAIPAQALENDRAWGNFSGSLDEALDQLCYQLVRTQFPVERVATPDPKGPGKRLSEFSVYLVEEINRRLAGEKICVDAGSLGDERKCRKAGKEVLERRGLYDLLRQQSLEQAPAFDPAEVASMYKKVGVDGLVMVTVQDHGSELWLGAKLVDVRRGSLLSSAKVRLDKSSEVEAMLERKLKADLTLIVKPPAPQGTVRVGSRVARLGPQGVTLRDLPQGLHRLIVEAPCRESQSREIYLSGDRTVSLELEPKLAALQLVVKPTDARVTLDGSEAKVFLDEQGMCRLELEPGEHVITAKAQGLPPQTRKIKAGCKPLSLTLDLTPPEHRLTLRVRPQNATVYLDQKRIALDSQGQWQGRVRQGSHSLRASAPGYRDQGSTLLVEGDAGHSLDLSRKTHQLGVRLRPKGARLTLDGQPVRLDPNGRAQIRAAQGRHLLRATAPGCAPYEKRIELTRQTSLKITLKPLPVELEFTAIYQKPHDPGEAIHKLEPGSVLKSGWYYAVALKVSRRAYVYIYQVDSAGKVSRLFPRPSFPALVNPVKPGRWLWSPPQGYRSVLDDHQGREVIFVLASSRPDEKYSGLYAKLQELKNDPAARLKANELMAEALFRGEAAVVKLAPGKVQYNGKLFQAARRIIQASGAGRIYSLEFEHR